MDVLTNHPPLADRLDLQYADLRSDIEKALDGVVTPAVASDDDVLLARNLILPLKEMQDRIERERKAEKDYFYKSGQTVDTFFKALRVELDAVVAAITAAVTAYQTRMREEAKKVEAAKARVATMMQESVPLPVAPKETVRVSAGGDAKVSGTVKWDWAVEDASQLPRDLLMPNEAAIKARVAGLKATVAKIEDAKIPGVRIFEKIGTTFR